MAAQFYFSRDTKVYLTPAGSTAVAWEIPVLDGFSFSQATNTSEITLAEASSGTNKSRRGRQMFTDSFAPAEWSFSTYMRPFLGKGDGSNASGAAAGATDWETSSVTTNKMHAVEEALWAFFIGASTFTAASGSTAGSWNDGVTNATSNLVFDWTASELSALTEFDLYFELGGATAGNDVCYKIANCAVNEASIDFDIDGIATIAWSGFGKLISESGTATPSFTKEITEGTTTTNNFIRNRLTNLGITAADTSTFPGAGSGVYNLVLTGGNVTISNNLTYLTPETLGVVNQPLGNVTGTRSISGNFTCYLDHTAGASADLFEDLIENTSGASSITNSFALTFGIGGASSVTPSVQIELPQCHFEVPAHSMDDIISLETNFHALPANLDPGTTADSYEIKVTYKGALA